MQCKEYSDANSELFKEEYDEALHENTCEIEFCDLISVSLRNNKQKAPACVGAFLRGGLKATQGLEGKAALRAKMSPAL